ncbi:hypothetical protein RvY_18077 [Ramazzottius varieornatus]|uniref:Uncharacterized protein n=1 Tax=Ramazzottius varieornatus TaxID=947166 RepID=A0A1D1W4F4_RAMVA|nr:hypothetical protein RvY_18077 [Ramazzottius varieornatus]
MASKIRHLLSRHHDRSAKRHSSYNDGELPVSTFPDAALDSGHLEMGSSSFSHHHGVPFIVVTSPASLQPEHCQPVAPFLVPAATVDNDDADFVAWLHVNNELELNKEVADHIDPHVRKRYLRYLSQLRAHDGLVRSSSVCALSSMGHARGSSNSLTTTSHSSDSTSGRRSATLIHVLHLDIWDRKKQRLLKKKEERLRNERLDMEKWEGRIKAQHDREVHADNEAMRDVTRPSSMLITA